MVKSGSQQNFPNVESNSFYEYLGLDNAENEEKLSISHNSMIGTSSVLGYYFNREKKIMERKTVKV